MDDNGLEKYPLNFDSINKGDTLSCEKLQHVTGKTPGTDEYRYAILGLQALIHERTEFTVKIQVDGSLRILTDPEASDHNNKLVLQGYRMICSRHERSLMVDVENLTEEQRTRHDSRLLIQSRYVTALTRETRQIRIESKAKPAELSGDGES
jgi:hypothetical protein